MPGQTAMLLDRSYVSIPTAFLQHFNTATTQPSGLNASSLCYSVTYLVLVYCACSLAYQNHLGGNCQLPMCRRFKKQEANAHWFPLKLSVRTEMSMVVQSPAMPGHCTMLCFVQQPNDLDVIGVSLSIFSIFSVFPVPAVQPTRITSVASAEWRQQRQGP
jgi:hypothetical protein